MEKHLILRIFSRILSPAILLFALYVQFHGDFGPGGGFQAGVIFGAGFILYGLLRGLDSLEQVVRVERLRQGAALGVLLFAGVGVITMLGGEAYLDYDALGHEHHKGQHYGILLIEVGVGLTVASVMLLLFTAFARRR